MLTKKFVVLWWLVFGAILILGCSSVSVDGSATNPVPVPTDRPTVLAEPTRRPAPIQTDGVDSSLFAQVLSVVVSGSENAYQFSVEIRSPDTGCEQYADWWEVVSEDGKLIYRRILTHSHVSEQPFRRSGGPLAIGADTIVIVRAHMHPAGYGSVAFRGSVASGFEAIQLEADFAPELERVAPLPEGCAF